MSRIDQVRNQTREAHESWCPVRALGPPFLAYPPTPTERAVPYGTDHPCFGAPARMYALSPNYNNNHSIASTELSLALIRIQ